MGTRDDIEPTAEEQALAERGRVLVAAAVADSSAPHSLREAIERERTRTVTPARRPFGALGRAGAALAGLAVVAAAVVIALPGGGSDHGLTVADVIAIGEHNPPTAGAPQSRGGRLDVSVDGVAFPDWTKLSWPPSGRRTDDVGGRRVETVFYEKGDKRISYSIVSGQPLVQPTDGVMVPLGNDVYRVSHDGERTVVTWEQAGQTCVVTSSSLVSDSKLVRLASAEASTASIGVKPGKLAPKL